MKDKERKLGSASKTYCTIGRHEGQGREMHVHE